MRHWWPKFCGAKTEKKKPEKDFRERGHEIFGTTVGRRGEHLLNAPHLFHTHVMCIMPNQHGFRHNQNSAFSCVSDLFYLDSLA